MKKLLAVALAAAVMIGVPSMADAATGNEKVTVSASPYRDFPTQCLLKVTLSNGSSTEGYRVTVESTIDSSYGGMTNTRGSLKFQWGVDQGYWENRTRVIVEQQVEGIWSQIEARVTVRDRCD